MFVHYIQKRGLFSEMRKFIQKVLRVLKCQNPSKITHADPPIFTPDNHTLHTTTTLLHQPQCSLILTDQHQIVILQQFQCFIKQHTVDLDVGLFTKFLVYFVVVQ